MSEYLGHMFNVYADPFGWATLAKILVIILIVTAVRSMSIAGLGYLFWWKLFAKALQHRRIQQRIPSAARLWNELRWSLSTFVVYTLLGFGSYFLWKMGFTRIYPKIADHGWGYFALSVVLMVILHDAYFYWTHRFLHLKPVFRRIHRVHHESLNPSPWAAFAFHPIEAAISFGILPLIVVVMPCHMAAVNLFLLYMTALNVAGHLGYELFWRGFTTHWLFGWHNTSTHHNMHHSKVHCNYGLYFNVWDRLMRTNHRAYHDTYEAVLA
ncbi:MAG TPA: sterol desaturase family protein, partial [Candidatus Sulfotelmatobacter sp.]|nr:sterol desaturase family protein [Candidatus Sulfotelmatobacter sp.]